MVEWLKLSSVGKRYVDMSPRSVHEWPKMGLKTVKLPSGTRMTKKEWIDEFLSTFEETDERKSEVDRIVNDVCKEFGV